MNTDIGTMNTDIFVTAALGLLYLLWPLRHRPAIRRRLRGLGTHDRALVYLALSVNESRPAPQGERALVDRQLALIRQTPCPKEVVPAGEPTA